MCNMKSQPALTFSRIGQDFFAASARVGNGGVGSEASTKQPMQAQTEALGGGPHTGTWRRTQ